MGDSIRAVERALDILMCFSIQTPELSMTQISAKVGIHKSTVHRFLATLEQMRFVQRDPNTGVYRPGIRMLQMAYLTLEHNDLRHLAFPFLRRLCEKYRENVNLSILDDADVVYVDVIESPQRVKLAAAVGQRLPAFSTASGKAILAYLPDDTVKNILFKGMPHYTQFTLKTEREFLDNIHQACEKGYAFSEQEFEEGINAVAAAILDRNNRPIASISVAGPAFRLTHEKMNEIGPAVVATAADIAKELQMAAGSPVTR